MTNYTIGVIGARRGLSLSKAFSLLSDCCIHAVCEPDDQRRTVFLQSFPEALAFTKVEDFLSSGLDVVVVASPVPLHAAHTVAALEAGCHVLQEVILGATVEECWKIRDAVLAHPKQKFMLAENCCYWAQIMSWQRMFAAGILGDFIYGEAEYIHNVSFLLRDAKDKPTWRASLPPIHYVTHSLGPMLMITGERCISVSGAHTGSKLNPDLSHLDMEVAIFQTASGGVIKILAGFGVVREPSFHYYSVYGTKGTLETARPPASLHTHAYLDSLPFTHGMAQLPLDYDLPGAPEGAHSGGHGTAEYYMVKDFMDSVRRGTTPAIDINAALAMSLPGLFAHQSAINGGKPFTIPAIPG